ncbi:MAG: hydrogenase 3 maturation endopeptidase HyCI [Clostridia bacterium]|jgi:hydrogenase 3 maturation protease|nr:hydrogenase 3 maturation endopeptidase HyCI [Clostridia bacterium]MDH7573014.1 hydrogenase 3 maturation endopeptidase HyCI [Clostridia bacterium]
MGGPAPHPGGRSRVRAAARFDLLLGVGSPWLGDDGVGPWLARRLRLPGWQAIDCGTAPENFTGRVRALAPRRLVVVDAAVMGLVPGSLRRLRPEDLAAAAVPGHRLPWPLLAGYLARLCSEFTVVAVQPLNLEPGAGLSRPVLRAARRLTRLLSGNRLDALPLYGPGGQGRGYDPRVR